MDRLKAQYGVSHLQVARPPRAPSKVRSIAVAAGAGSGALRGVEADVFITGEMSHHDALAAVAARTSVVPRCARTAARSSGCRSAASTSREATANRPMSSSFTKGATTPRRSGFHRMIFLAVAVGWLCRALAAVAKFVCRAPTRAGSFAVALKVHLRLRARRRSENSARRRGVGSRSSARYNVRLRPSRAEQATAKTSPNFS